MEQKKINKNNSELATIARKKNAKEIYGISPAYSMTTIYNLAVMKELYNIIADSIGMRTNAQLQVGLNTGSLTVAGKRVAKNLNVTYGTVMDALKRRIDVKSSDVFISELRDEISGLSHIFSERLKKKLPQSVYEEFQTDISRIKAVYKEGVKDTVEPASGFVPPAQPENASAEELDLSVVWDPEFAVGDMVDVRRGYGPKALVRAKVIDVEESYSQGKLVDYRITVEFPDGTTAKYSDRTIAELQ